MKKKGGNGRLRKLFLMIGCFMGLKIEIIVLKIGIEKFL